MIVKEILRKNRYVDEMLKRRYVKKVIGDSLEFPKSFHIEPTNSCNLACIMCPRTKSERGVGMMDFALFTKIIDEIAAEVNAPKISFHKDGEPLIHPDIFKMVSYARKKIPQSTLRFSTNGLLLTPKKIEKLFEVGLDSMTISMDGVNKSTYEKIRVRGNFDKLKENVDNLIAYKKRHKFATPKICVQTIEMNETADEIDAFRKQWKNRADSVVIKPLLNWSGQISKGERGENKNHRYPCLSLWVNPAISWNGDVSICCTYIDRRKDDPGVIGNVREKSLKEIWQGERMSKIRLAHLQNDYDKAPFCTKCQDWQYGIKSINVWSEDFKQKMM